LIEKKPRKLLFSNEFYCPPEIQENINKLLKKIEQGESLTSHLTTRVLDEKFNNSLLNDWGIKHLHHNSEKKKNSPFTIRDKFVLFGVFTTDAALLIQLWDHKNWGDTKILDIVHRNWPELINNSVIKGAIGLSTEVNAKEREDVRKRSNILTQMPDGTIYYPPGFGSNTSGSSLGEIKWKQEIYNKFRIVETLVRGLEDEIHSTLTKVGGNVDLLDIHLAYENSKLILYKLN
jgi:hypothetical protein